MGQLRKQFAKRLKELRQQKGMTQEDLAKATGLSVSFIRAVEQGINSPSFNSLETISSALGLDVKQLFDFNEEH
ncbi:MAG: hypothetical protein Kow0080_09520 [Candidatus Promineifilaceae bacterium]